MKVAVVLFNLGAPDRLEAVRPFLRNLFGDPAILRLPWPLRVPLARLIAWRRAAAARRIYAAMGGASPLLAETVAQAEALAARLADAGGAEFSVFVAMRHWRPSTGEAVRRVAAEGPDRIVLLPLYPQFSTTTTASSLAAWRREARARGLSAPTATICCYPDAAGWVASQADLLAGAICASGCDAARLRVLFSAHGLPKRIVQAGDPYPEQVDRTARAVVASLAGRFGDLDWRVCYQSRVGPLDWIGPSTAAEVERGAREGKVLVVAPISFVSEHAETLVELDMEYRALAERNGAPGFHRVPAVGTHGDFIAGLATMAAAAARGPAGTASMPHGRLCGAAVGACPGAAAPLGG